MSERNVFDLDYQICNNHLHKIIFFNNLFLIILLFLKFPSQATLSEKFGLSKFSNGPLLLPDIVRKFMVFIKLEKNN